jgi:predicted transcriptional regulator
MGMTSVRMPDELMAKLNEAAEKMRRSKGWIINDAVTEYLAREERNNQMLEETKEALADIKAGRVVDGVQVIEWLSSWGTEDEKSPPEL